MKTIFVFKWLACLALSTGAPFAIAGKDVWSYPPRAWPRWEVLRARAYTYECGMYVGYPVVLDDAMKCARFRDPDGRELAVSAASQGGVPCVRGIGYQVLDGNRWVDCDVFEGTDGQPPHLCGLSGKIVRPELKDGLYTADGEVVAYVHCRAEKCPLLRVGESASEARNEDMEWFEQSCRMVPGTHPGEWRSFAPLAFRHYRFVGEVAETWCELDELQAEPRHRFSCADERRNRIWNACAKTVRLCARRFFVDSVKRDRMPWPGDDAVGFLGDSATYGNAGVARFTIDALGCAKKDGFADYSPWWVVINGLYRRLYDDPSFIRRRWDVIRDRTDRLAAGMRPDGEMAVSAGTKLFIDWGERGRPTTAYNVLAFAAFDTAAALAEEMGETTDAARWQVLAGRVREAIFRRSYDSKTGLFRTDMASAKGPVYRQANLLAVLFGLVRGEAAGRIGDVLAGDGLPPVGTTWMNGLECVALTVTGHTDETLRRIDRDWGGIVDLGYDTVFEHWWSDAKGADVYRFYGRPFGLALCHVTATAPAFLLPRIQCGDHSNPFECRPRGFH